jgi:hypothetical protein
VVIYGPISQIAKRTSHYLPWYRNTPTPLVSLNSLLAQGFHVWPLSSGKNAAHFMQLLPCYKYPLPSLAPQFSFYFHPPPTFLPLQCLHIEAVITVVDSRGCGSQRADVTANQRSPSPSCRSPSQSHVLRHEQQLQGSGGGGVRGRARGGVGGGVLLESVHTHQTISRRRYKMLSTKLQTDIV